MAFLSVSSKGNSNNGKGAGAGGSGNSKAGGGGGGYFSSRSSRNSSSSSSSSSGRSGGNGSSNGGVGGAAVSDCGGGSVCHASSDYGLLEMDENDNSFPWGLLHHNELALMLNNGLGKTMVIDSRSFLEYNTTNIQQSVNVCCSKLVKRRLQQDKVHVLDLLSQTCHIGADASWDVIVYDQCTEDPSLLTADNFVHVLLRKLSTAFNSVAFLKGGFLAFQASHSQLVENKSSSYRCSTLTSLSQPCMPVSNVGPTRILSFLYLGSQKDSLAQEMAQVNGITYILNVSKTCPRPPFILESHFHRIPINDNYCERLLPFFQEAFQFLDKVREANGCALVHCMGGVSRSATLTIAYIMKHMKMSSDDAYRYVKDKRPTISPNFNFLGQLLEYEKIVRRDETEEAARREAMRALRGGEDDAGSRVMDRASPMSAMDLHTSSPSSPGPRSAVRPSCGLDSVSPLSAVSPLAQTNPKSQDCPFPGPGFLVRDQDASVLVSPPPQHQPSPCDDSSKRQQQQSASLHWQCTSSTSSSSSSSRAAASAKPLALRQDQATSLSLAGGVVLPSSDSNSSSSPTPSSSRLEAGEVEACPLLGPALCELRPYPGPSYQNPAYTQPLGLDMRGHNNNDDQVLKLAAKAGVEAPLCDKNKTGLPGTPTCGSRPFKSPTPASVQSPSTTCPVTGFPSPAASSQDGPSSTCLMTGFPGPEATSPGHDLSHRSSHAFNQCHISLDNKQLLTSSSTTTSTTYHSQDLNTGQSQWCDSPSTAVIASPPDSLPQQKAKQGFSLSSMFSSFRWRSRPPTLTLGSPVGPAKDRRKRGESTVLATQLTPVSEISETCDVPMSGESSTDNVDGSENLNSNQRSSDDAPITIDHSVSKVDQSISSCSPTTTFSPPLPATNAGAGMPNTATTTISKNVKITPAKTRSLKMSPRNFFLSLSSPTSDFYISSALSSASPTSHSLLPSSSRLSSSSQSPNQSPSSPKQSLPSPGDSNKRKSGLLSHFDSPDKLARKEDPHAPSTSPLSPPKTLNLAPSGASGAGKPRQRLGIKKPSFLTLSSPTAAMARLNFASPSKPSQDFLPSSMAAEQNNSEMDASGFSSQDTTSVANVGPNVLPAACGRESNSDLSLEDRNTFRQVGNSHQSVRENQGYTSSLTESTLSAFSASMSSSSCSSSQQSFMSASHSSALDTSSCSSEGASSSSMSASSSAVSYQGFSKFPTTSLDKLSFTPCSVRDIVQDLKNSNACGSDAVMCKSEDQCSLLTDSQAPSSALDSPMSISSGSSAPSLASSTLSPVDSSMTNPFPISASGGARETSEEGSLAFQFSHHHHHQSHDEAADVAAEESSSFTDSGVQSGHHSIFHQSSQDNTSAACTPDSMLSPSSSLPQASISPATPSLTSPCYSCTSSMEPLSPMSLDDSNFNSPICSPTSYSSSPICSPTIGGVVGGVCSASSLYPSPLLTCPSSSIYSLTNNSSIGLASSFSSSSSSSSTLLLSSSSSSTTTTSSSSASKVVLRKDRGGRSGSSKRMALARPNSIAFSSYPACDLTIDPAASSCDDASEEFMAVSSKNARPLLSPETQARLGRTSWGGYSEREVYRQITEAMESAMLRTQAYVPRRSPSRPSALPLPSPNVSRKARSLDDILDGSDIDIDEQHFQSGSSSGLAGGTGGGEIDAASRSGNAGGGGGGQSSRFRVGFSPDKSLPASMLFEQYHCGMHGGAEPYQSNSSLSSNGSHNSLHGSLEVIQLPR